jgi:hypothetical protein
VHGEKVACVFQARAPEKGASTRTERRLRSSDPKGGGEFTCRLVSEMDVDALRFTDATRDVLARAERARVVVVIRTSRGWCFRNADESIRHSKSRFGSLRSSLPISAPTARRRSSLSAYQAWASIVVSARRASRCLSP